MRKKILLMGVTLGMMAVVWSGCKTSSAETVYSDRFEQSKFREPENRFRAVPFYSLNDSLSADELRRQLHLFHEAGYGGAFLHSRIGLLTPYLEKEWFDMMKVGTETLQSLGMDAWYYDEDKWPSGFAGGIVPRQDSSFRARALVRMVKSQEVTPPDSVLCEDANYKYVACVDPMGQPWFNGTSWVDLMNPAMVQAFIDCSYKPYAERFGRQPHVMGIFTDEPQVPGKAHVPNEGVISYSPVMEKVFKEKWGYDLNPVLPSLFDTVGNWRTVRLHYYRTVAYCLEMAFSKPIGDYCAKEGMIWTGHYLAEDNSLFMMNNQGDLMQQLRHMQQPGIDALGLRYNTVYCGKIATSVANQYGQRRRLSELFGISGHNMSFEDKMWITSWHTIMGINFMCPHLYLYSMKGTRKYDFPPTISHQQPYFSQNKLFEDYSARLCYFATVGSVRPEVCVLNPMETFYIQKGVTELDSRNADYEQLLNDLMATHLNFDMGDEQIISEIGKVTDGRLEVGKMAYPVVVIPDMLTIRASTLKLLDEFSKAGGAVFVCGNYPQLVDGVVDAAAIDRLKASAPQVQREALAATLQAKAAPEFALTSPQADSIWSHLREVEGGFSLQLSNTSRLSTLQAKIRFTNPALPVKLWNPVNGKCLSMEAQDGAYTLEFAPAQTWILTAGAPSQQAEADGVYHLPGARTPLMTLSNQWNGKRLDPNAIKLDFATFSKDEGKTWSKPEPVLAFSDRAALSEPYNGKLQMKFQVEIDKVPAACSLVVEQPHIYNTITVNGSPVKFSGKSFYVDEVFKSQEVQKLLKQGTNDIVLGLDYIAAIPASYNAIERYGTEIESIYLIGDFGVKGVAAGEPLSDTWRNRQKRLPRKAAVNRFASFSLVGESSVVNGDLTLEGYPFYAGRYQLTQHFSLDAVKSGERYLLSFPGFESILIGVKVNGKEFQSLITSPWEVDITSALKTGDNELVVTLTNSLRNLMGPHHHMGGEFSEVGPGTFRGNADWPNTNIQPGDRDWYDARVRGNAILWRDAYHMIPFGLLQAPVLLVEKAEK